jgi:hypothetical protein
MARRIPLSQLLSAGLALAAALLTAPHAAAAATSQGHATAIIRSGVTMRAMGRDAARPLIQAASADLPPPREVVRPCRPIQAGDSARCRLILLELQ